MSLTVITRFVASEIGKIYELRTEKLRELEAPWLCKYFDLVTRLHVHIRLMGNFGFSPCDNYSY